MVLLAIERWRGNKTKIITAEHIQRAEDHRVRSIQADSYANEIRALKAGSEIDKKSNILQLTPFINADGIHRVGGRASRAETPGFMNEPPILDGAHPATRLLVNHEKMMHGAHETVENEIKQRFWVLNLQELYAVNLPPARVAYALRPFNHCGVDYFGPMLVKNRRRREKRWGSCLREYHA